MAQTTKIRHVRGPRLLRPNEVTRRLFGWTKGYRGLRVGNVYIPHRKEYEHLLILGSQGSGKTSLIRAILQQIERRKQVAVVIDPETEFAQEFYRPERGDYILNPLDERGPFWSPWLEFREHEKAMDVQALVASLVRGRNTNDEQLYWRDQTSELFEKLFYQTTNLATLKGLIDLDKTDGKQGAYNRIRPFKLLPNKEQTTREWSAVNWAANPKGWLFLTSTDDSRDSVQRLQGIWLDLIIRRLMSQELYSNQIWIVADEVATMGYQPELVQSLITRGRKRGLSLILSLQNIAQLRTIYGHDPTMTLASQPGTTILFKCKEPETAEWCSKLIGTHEIADQWKRWWEPLVGASEIETLPTFHAYIIAGEYRAPLQVKPRFLKAQHPGFIFRQPVLPEYPTPKPLLSKLQKLRWKGIVERTQRPTHRSYAFYGGKGVELRFRSADQLFAEIGPPPDEVDDWTIDRIRCGDPHCHAECGKHYEPKHVRWATKQQQTDNRVLNGDHNQ